MDSNTQRAWLPFGLAFFSLMICLRFFPNCHLQFFVPFLVANFYRLPLGPCLSWALTCGTILDLLADTHPFGLHATAYGLACIFLYEQRRNFFADSWTTVPMMTFLFSLVSTLVLVGSLSFFGRGIETSVAWAFTDLLSYPILDSLFALLAFEIPQRIWNARPVSAERFRRARPE